jgi:transposase InsO family protein
VCKQYRIKRLKPPATSDLPEFRAEFTKPFAATGVDFAGPLFYKTIHGGDKSKKVIRTEKIYIAIFTCAATRAVHLALCTDMTAPTFQLALKEFVARRGRPSLIVSDNAKTFQSTSNWLKYLTHDESLFNYLGRQNIRWRFNLSRAPWWGGFYERLIGIMKRSLSKSIGQSLLTYNELKEALLDVECFMNERPLIYVGDECEQPVLTPNLLIRDSQGQFLEEDLDKINYTDEEVLVTKRMKYLKRTRELLRKRWQQEYLRALEERHTRNDAQKQKIPQPGSVVLITDTAADKKPKWTLGKVTDVIRGRDHIIRGLKVRCGSGYTVERPLQLVRDLEISAYQAEETINTCLTPVGADSVATALVLPPIEQKQASNDARLTPVGANSALKGPALPPIDDEDSSRHLKKSRKRESKTAATDKILGITLNELDEQ